MVRPLRKWLDERGVVFELNTRLTDLGYGERDRQRAVTRIAYERDRKSGEITIGEDDFVLVTLVR